MVYMNLNIDCQGVNAINHSENSHLKNSLIERTVYFLRGENPALPLTFVLSAVVSLDGGGDQVEALVRNRVLSRTPR